VTIDQVEAIGPAFTEFLRPFEYYLDSLHNVRHFRNYTRGLLTDLERKTAEPLALYAGVPVRNLQQFLKACVWDHEGLVDAVQRRLLTSTNTMPGGAIGTVAIIDETSATKKGAKTPGVQRQYLGCEGKVENGIVTVHLSVARGTFKALLDGELFLPESWDQDRERCRAADIPDDVHYRAKWWIALELIGRAERNGWAFDWMTFDEWYGGKPDFLNILDIAGTQYVGEVPKTFSCRPGRCRTAMSAEAVFSRPGVRRHVARRFRLEQQTGPPTVWQAKSVAVCLREAHRPRHLLICARNRETGEVKYFIARMRRRTSLRKLLQVAFTRWNVEHMFRVAKSEVGLTHFEGRSYVSLKRHLALCLVALAFVALHTMRLRGKKPGGDFGASVPPVEANLPAIPEPPSRHE
jgi:SRSO17 transposase